MTNVTNGVAQRRLHYYAGHGLGGLTPYSQSVYRLAARDAIPGIRNTMTELGVLAWLLLVLGGGFRTRAGQAVAGNRGGSV